MENLFEDKVVLITGGTGFLGRALVKEILKQKPQSIRVFSRDEVKHYNMQQDLGFNSITGPVRYLVGDVRDYERLKKATKGCDIVIHAAAMKRIDMIEYNVEEAIKTNIMGSLNLVHACLENNVNKVVFISTDKACSPINTYGACKFVSERIFIESNYNKGKSKTSFICVRYGNVLNSTGSVIPFFINKIKNNKKIPITNKEMTRFIINEDQAVRLVFDAIKYGMGGEIFVPKIPSSKIVDLAIYLNKKHGGSKNEIEVIGTKPGEKIHELMINETESKRTLQFRNIFVILSEIEKYIGMKRNQFLERCKKVNFKEYNSNNSLIFGEKLEEYLKSLGV